MNRVDVVFNTAAMKHVPACENNPMEAIKTNIIGAMNIVDGAINNNIGYVMHISTDKAVYPVNLYGGTKLVAEKLFLNGNIYTGGHGTKLSCCRYGNVIGSRGSIIPLFLEQYKSGKITLTHEHMTRFWITLDTVADFVIAATERTKGNETYIPVMPSVRILDIIEAMFPEHRVPIVITGTRPGEKIHECLMSYEESEHAYISEGRIILDPFITNGERWSYNSGNNVFLQGEEIRQLIKHFMEEHNV